MDTDNLRTRVEALEVRDDLLNIEGQYARFYDSRDAHSWASLFTEDGIYQGRQLAGMPTQNFVSGRSALAEFCQTEPATGIHSMHVPHFVTEEDSATARVHFQFDGGHTDDHGRQHSRAITGYYDVRYAKVDGRWLIAHRVTTYIETVHRIRHPYERTPFDFSAALPEHDENDARR